MYRSPSALLRTEFDPADTTYGCNPATSAGKLGIPTSVAYGNGGIQAYDYDPIGRLTSLTVGLAGTASDLTKTFDYNPASQIVEEERDNDAYAQAIGNGTQTTVANGLNQIASVNGIAATHDARGNLTTDPVTGKTYSYWVIDNQLKNVASPYLTMGYDALSRLRYDTHGSTTTNYVSDGASIVAEYDDAGPLLARFAFGGMGEPLVAYDASGNRSWMQSDERGSVIALASDSAVMTAINSYDEYGAPGASNAGAFQYAGQMWMSRPGVYYNLYREYAPQLGRFLQTDPIGMQGGINLYAYVGNDPVNYVDPLGLTDAYPVEGGIWNCDWLTSGYTCSFARDAQIIVTCREAVLCYSMGGLPGREFRDPTIGPSRGGGVSGGGRGGGGGGGDQAEVRTRMSCALEAYNKNKLALGLDLAGALVAIFLPEASLGSFVANSIIGVGGIGVAAANQDVIGSGIAWGGRHAAMSQSFGWGAVMSRISAGAVILSSARDLLNLKTDYDHCMADN